MASLLYISELNPEREVMTMFSHRITICSVLLLRYSLYLLLIPRWWGGGRCAAFKKTSTSGTKELDMPNIAGIFLVITGGAALAVVVCFLEYIHRRLMKRRLNKKVCMVKTTVKQTGVLVIKGRLNKQVCMV